MNITYDASEMCAKIDTELLNKKDDARFDFVIGEISNWGWDFKSTAMWGLIGLMQHALWMIMKSIKNSKMISRKF